MRDKVTVVLALASLVAVVGSCLWAWADEHFWEDVPLYPCVGVAGLLAALAVVASRKRLVKAAGIGSLVALTTLVGTAVITLYRWEF